MSAPKRGEIHYLKRGGELVLYLSGDVTAPLAVALYEHLRPHFDAGDVDHVHIDLSRVAYMDSTTIGTMIKAHKVLQNRSGSLLLWNLSSEARKILRTMHLLEYFHVETDEALEKLRSGVLDRIAPSEKEFITDEYVLSAHQDIVEAEPSLAEKFEPLITVLKQRIAERNEE